MERDTIAAIATAMSEAGIGIIRISGKDAVAIADKVYVNAYGKHTLKQKKSHTISYGFILDHGENDFYEEWKKDILDECMVSVFRAPLSYTKEDTVEINCHGGMMVMQAVLEVLLKSGARLAQPGEFTKRAFLNGRMDLSEAEAVMDLIHSQSKMAMEVSLKQLTGQVYRKIKEMRSRILYEIAFIESALDDPEHISLEGYEEKLQIICTELIRELEQLICSARDGILRKEGIRTAIVGRPNAGKSSVMNVLLKEERAIVTDIAGTTRDVLKEYLQIGGIGLHIMDTAGIRDTEDIVEKIGVEKAKNSMEESDLILHVLDRSLELGEEDENIRDYSIGKTVIVLLNKSDLESKTDEKKVEALYQNRNVPIISVSAKTGEGVEKLEETIQSLFFDSPESHEEVLITSLRHKEALTDALHALQNVENSLSLHMPEDFFSIDLMGAYQSLGSIIGEEVDDDLVEEIFTKFCMGK